jgi:hypothetical protein
VCHVGCAATGLTLCDRPRRHTACAAIDERRQDRRRAADLPHDVLHVDPNRVVYQIARLSSRTLDRRTDQREQRRQVSFRFSALCSCRHRAALLVTHQDERRRVEMHGRILDAGQLGVGGDVTCDADVEKIAKTLIEDDFRRGSRVGAAQDNRVWLLRRGKLALARGGLVRVLIAFVA